MTDCKDKCWCKKFSNKEIIKPQKDDPAICHDLYEMAYQIEHLYDGIEKCFERIEKIDDFLLIRDKINKTIMDRLENLEGYMETEDRITASDVLFKIDDIYKSIAVMQNQDRTKVRPHKCPVCDVGIRLQPGSGGLGLSYCKTCEGKGIVWG